LLLSSHNAKEIKVGVALSVEIYVYRVEHHCAPVAFCMELSGIAHATRSAGIVGDYWKVSG
jgi:hypothetical protein